MTILRSRSLTGARQPFAPSSFLLLKPPRPPQTRSSHQSRHSIQPCKRHLTQASSPTHQPHQPDPTPQTPSGTQSAFDIIIVGAGIAGLTAALSLPAQSRTTSSDTRDKPNSSPRILLLDAAHGGGATRLSGGVVYMGGGKGAGGTKQQSAAGYVDSTENMFRYLRAETRGSVLDSTLREFCEGSRERGEWLEGMGVRFGGEADTGGQVVRHKASYPPDGKFLYFSGSEKAWPFVGSSEKVLKEERDANGAQAGAIPVPRGHRVVGKGVACGSELYKALKARVDELENVTFKPTAKVKQLHMTTAAGQGRGEAGSGEGQRFSGISYRALRPNSWPSAFHRWLSGFEGLMITLPLLARPFMALRERIWKRYAEEHKAEAKAVVLCAGGYIFNHSLVAHHAPRWAGIRPLGTIHDDGSGIALGESVGGIAANMHRLSGWRFIYAPEAFVSGVVVASDGNRFVNEDVYGARLTERMIEEHGGRAWLIVDEKVWEKATSQMESQVNAEMLPVTKYLFSRYGHTRADTVEELARKIGVDAAGIQSTVAAYNDAQERREEDPWHKQREACTPLHTPPFRAINISVLQSSLLGRTLFFVPALSLGGLKVNEETGEIQHRDGGVVKGVYAAGRNALGICGESYVSGLSLADGVFSGMRAAKHAAKNVTEGQ